jgi:hypothetical protein
MQTERQNKADRGAFEAEGQEIVTEQSEGYKLLSLKRDEAYCRYAVMTKRGSDAEMCSYAA